VRLLFTKAFFRLMLFDYFLARGDFKGLNSRVEKFPLRNKCPAPEAKERIVTAVNNACVWYPKRSLCLQRSAVLTCMLRSYGFPAAMVVGTQRVPFKAHAWVELDGQVVNDKPDMPELYAEIQRC
jgi:Transglutaminase-like superfamily